MYGGHPPAGIGIPGGIDAVGGSEAGASAGAIEEGAEGLGPPGCGAAAAPQLPIDELATPTARSSWRLNRTPGMAIGTLPVQIWAEQNAYVYW